MLFEGLNEESLGLALHILENWRLQERIFGWRVVAEVVSKQDGFLQVVIDFSLKVLDFLDVLVVGKVPKPVIVILLLVALTLLLLDIP